MYKVLVEFDKNKYETYEFNELSFAEQIYDDAKENGLNALILDKSGNVVKN
jgi:cell division protein FtsL